MSTPTDISTKTTHDLWVDARQFSIELSRPTPNTVKVTVTRPVDLSVTDGAVVLLSEKPISTVNYPKDGEPYSAVADPDWLAPIERIGDAQVVGAYHAALSNPFPPTHVGDNLDAAGYPIKVETFSIIVSNTNPKTVYYASVHAASNVMQYYPIGMQSYPINGPLAERSPGSYTGNIPSYPSAPTAPSPGMVYHDQVLNIVQYYDGSSGSWIPTRADSILSGPYNPGVRGQVYMIGGTLKIFDGVRWVVASSANILLRSTVGDPWVKMTSFSTVVWGEPSPAELGAIYYDYALERVFYYNGSAWVPPHSKNSLLDLGTTQVEAFITPMTVEPEELPNPYIGKLFYNLTTHELNAWNGSSWNKVNTDQDGVTSADKVNIGTDGSYDERVDLIKILNGQLGWPQLCVELQEEQFNIAIDNALQNYRQLSSGAYRRGFVLYRLIPGQQKYYLNSAIDKTDHIVDIHKIHRCGPLGVFGGGPNDVWSQAFAQQYYNLAAGGGDILSTHLVAAYGEELNRLFAGDLTFQWDEASHELILLRAIRGSETVIIEAMLERTEQEILKDRWCQQYIQNWALAELKMMLGLIRSKFSSGTPGPGGTINLNGELLVSEARQDMIELKEELMNYEYGGLVGMGNCSFLMG